MREEGGRRERRRGFCAIRIQLYSIKDLFGALGGLSDVVVRNWT